jgi:hypothetical protein
MNLHIEPNRLISDIQKEFNKVFPFLKLEFFYNKNQSRSKFSAKEIIPHNKKIGDEQRAVTDGEIIINDEMKVNELENIFKQKFSLSAQVFRKSGNLWLETTMTDDWTLQQQNNHGREISTETKKDNAANDYDLNRDAGS